MMKALGIALLVALLTYAASATLLGLTLLITYGPHRHITRSFDWLPIFLAVIALALAFRRLRRKAS